MFNSIQQFESEGIKNLRKAYEIFKGRHQTLDEIEAYVYNQIEITKDCYKLGKNLIYDWKNMAVSQSEDEFERHSKIYFIVNGISMMKGRYIKKYSL
ncbi:hypothetical protein [Oribacterium sp. WCC10]|uniref:hypothetical protein n=1 Tax=Oribacterium sp. WCC10 TaxID=1855343 RepID=UPI0008E3FF41|nr:hypothetical protein [Oribacterium sp. WCC10]SFG59742.1 hypothetical protein SAMN05216356_11458 [Oribacterium sp. WCC10]